MEERKTVSTLGYQQTFSPERFAFIETLLYYQLHESYATAETSAASGTILQREAQRPRAGTGPKPPTEEKKEKLEEKEFN